MQFKPVDLFGGAITSELPATFKDVSRIREVPNHQEVYIDPEGFSSIVFDILEREEKPSDLEALKSHFSDIVDEVAGSATIHNTSTATLAQMPNIPALTLIATAPPGEIMRGKPYEPDFVGIALVLIRLEEQKTDIVVSVNVPHLEGSYVKEDVDPANGKYGPQLEVGKAVREKVLETFEVKDFGLFGGEE